MVGVWIFSGTTQFRPCDVLQGINLAFIVFLNHAYSLVLLCTCMHTYRTTFELSSSLGYHLLVWNDRKTKHTLAKKSICWENIDLLVGSNPQILTSYFKKNRIVLIKIFLDPDYLHICNWITIFQPMVTLRQPPKNKKLINNLIRTTLYLCCGMCRKKVKFNKNTLPKS